jgi:hypothetical protein
MMGIISFLLWNETPSMREVTFLYMETAFNNVHLGLMPFLLIAK